LNSDVDVEDAVEPDEIDGLLPFVQVKVCGGEEALWKVTIPLQGDPADTAQSMEMAEGGEEDVIDVLLLEHGPVVDLPVRGKAAR
jgi:hypothetical protein